MQFIHDSLFQTTSEEEWLVDSAAKEFEPGVVVERRMVLGCALGALATLFCPLSKRTFGQESSAGPSKRSNTKTIELETRISRLRP